MMVLKGLEFAVAKDSIHNCFTVYGRVKWDNGQKEGFVMPVSVTVPVGDMEGMATQPMMELTPQGAVQLMDELWNAGVHPTEVSGPGELGATKKHLEDMRKIVFSYMELQK